MSATRLRMFLDASSRNRLFGQFLRYLVTGGLAFVVDFGLFAVCLYAFKWHYLIANLMGLVAGLIINYILSIVWVFVACKRTLEKNRGLEFLLFSLVGVAGIGINQLLMYSMVGQFGWNEMLSKVIAAGLVLVWNFSARKFMLFREKRVA